MKMIKKILAGSVLLLLPLFFAGSANADIAPTVQISDLPQYINYNSFNLSYTAISQDPSTITATFYVKKEGGSYSAFGSTVNGASGQIQVTGSQVNDHTKYFFKVEISSSNGSASDETNTIYDVNGPSPVSNYWKENPAGGMYRLHWKNPNDDDFAFVYIYRSTEQNFTANGSTKVADVGGNKDEEKSWEDVGLDPNKKYYYGIIAIDKAGNPSSLVHDSDAQGTSETSTTTTTTIGEGEVTQLPQTQGQGTGGQVLGEEEMEGTEGGEMVEDEVQVSEPDTEKGLVAKTLQFAKDRTKITVGILIVLAGIAYFVYKRFFVRS